MTEPYPQTIPHAAQRAASSYGDAIALSENGRSWSFVELWQEARAVASAMIAEGVGKGDRIALWAPNRSEWILAALGAQIAGAAIVPLNTRLKGREAADMLGRARCSMLFSVRDFLGVNYFDLIVGENLPALKTRICLETDWAEFVLRGAGAGDEKVDIALSAIGPDDLSDILFTSGTTGAPKGVMSTHGRVVPLFGNWAKLVSLCSDDVYLIANPFFHTFGYKAGWVACLLTGAKMVPMPVFDTLEAIKYIEAEHVSFIPGPPTIYQSLLAELDNRKFDASSLRVAVTGAATVPPVLVERMQKELGFTIVITGYGMTECGNITMCRAGDPIDLIAHTSGRAVPDLEVRCIDDDGQAVEAGQAGEVIVRGYGVMLGYLDDPQATAAAIDPDGWLHTGDIGVLDGKGYLRITDRKKDMYISGGFNCYPAEIEKLLSEHPAVEMVAVIGVADERMGEVGKAFIVPRPRQNVSEAEIIAWARSNMANYKAPRSVVFIRELPKNAAGKVMKDALR